MLMKITMKMMMVPRDTSQKGEDEKPPRMMTPRDNNNTKDNNKDKSQKGEDGNPPGITTPREDDDSYPDDNVDDNDNDNDNVDNDLRVRIATHLG